MAPPTSTRKYICGNNFYTCGNNLICFTAQSSTHRAQFSTIIVFWIFQNGSANFIEVNKMPTPKPFICANLKGKASGDKFLESISIATDEMQVKFEPAPNVRTSTMAQLRDYESLGLKRLAAVNICEGSIGSLITSLRDETNLCQMGIAHLKKCISDYNYVSNSLLTQNHQYNKADDASLTYTTCETELKKVNIIWEKTIRHGHSAHSHREGAEKTYEAKNNCKNEPQWKEWGYLANGAGKPCTDGLIKEFDFNNRQCSDKVQHNVNGASQECRIGFRNFGGHTRHAYAIPTDLGNRSCSFGCFSRDELFETLTNQPLCLSCLTPYMDMFWETNCFDQDHRVQAISLRSVIIYKDYTDFKFESSSKSCKNTWSFYPCCGGRGPVLNGEENLVDKYCACKIHRVSSGETIYHTLVDLYHALCGANQAVLYPVLVIVLIIVSPRAGGLIALAWALYHVAGAKATCSASNIVGVESVLDQISTRGGYRSEFKVQSGQCVSLGDAMFMVTSISKRHLYRFEKTVPYKVKLTCANVDWGCWGGSQSQLASRDSTCSESCQQGVVSTSQEKVPSFAGSGCAAFWEGVLLRQDVCFSIGEFGSQCRFYRHVSYDPVVVIKGMAYLHGERKVREMELIEGEATNGIKLKAAMIHHREVPMTIVKRGATHLCSSVEMDLNSMCGSITLLRPNDIQPACYELKAVWDQSKATYMVTYRPKDAEAILHNKFHECNEGSNVTFEAEEAFYYEKSNLALLTIISDKINFAEGRRWCDLASLAVDSKPGVTGFRQSTHVEISQKALASCVVIVYIPGCTELQSRLIVVSRDENMGLEFYCHGNASATLTAVSEGTVKTFPIKEVNKNWIPLKTTIANVAIGTLLKAQPAHLLADSLAWISSVNIGGFFSRLLSFVQGKILDYAIAAVAMVVAYNGVMRGNLTNVVIAMTTVYYFVFIKVVNAIEIDLAVAVSIPIKLVRANSIWFMSYNLVDSYFAAEMLDTLVYIVLGIISCFLFNTVLGMLYPSVIKFLVKYLDESRFMDGMYQCGRELRFPGVLWISNLAAKRNVFKHRWSRDIYSEDSQLVPYVPWKEVALDARRIMLSDGPRPVPWGEVWAKILCQQHARAGINNVRVGGGYFAYEWRNGKLEIYVSAHIVAPNQSLLSRVYGDVWVCTSRQVVGKPVDCIVPRGEIKDGIIEGISGEDMKGMSGYTCRSEVGIYVIHEANQEGQLIEHERVLRPRPPITAPPISCSECNIDRTRDQHQPADSNSENMEVNTTASESTHGVATESGTSHNDVADDAGCSTGLSRTTTTGDVGEQEIIETKHQKEIYLFDNPRRYQVVDGWGARYTVIEDDNKVGYISEDIKIWASHVNTDEGVHILPDIKTNGPAFRPYAPVSKYCWFFTSFEEKKLATLVCDPMPYAYLKGGTLTYVEAYVMEAEEKLVSGQLIYLWVKGFMPRLENFKVASVVTVSRKVRSVYQYAVINDESLKVDMQCRVKDGLGYINRVEYCKNRQIATGGRQCCGYELNLFAGKQMVRFLNKEGQVLSSFEFKTNTLVDPFDWQYHHKEKLGEPSGSIPVAFEPCSEDEEEDTGRLCTNKENPKILAVHRETHPVGHMLADSINAAESFPTFCAGLIQSMPVSSEATAVCVPVMAVAVKQGLSEPLEFCVDIMNTGVDKITYTGSRIVMYTLGRELHERVPILFEKLWKTGIEVICVRGELLRLASDTTLSPYDFFVGCETRETPTIIWLTEKQSETLEFKQWLITELEDRERDQLVELQNINIHRDWVKGSMALTPVSKHSVTQRSLAEWRQHQSFPGEEIDFMASEAHLQCTSVEQVLGLTEGSYWAGELQCFTSRGSCVGQYNEIVTSNHVTRGATVKLFRDGSEFVWEKPFYSSAKDDVCSYGEKPIKTCSAQQGEIVCVLCPLRKIAQFLIVSEVRSEYATRPGAVFYSMRPIEVDNHLTKWLPCSWGGVPGMSGCGVYNSRGELVSIYGLGRVECKPIPGAVPGTSEATPTSALTVMAPDMRPEIVPDTYFKTAALEAINSTYSEPYSYLICSAPTGTGKTLHFTKNLLENIKPRSKVLLLQPTTAGVVGAFNRLVVLADVNGGSSGVHKFQYVIGKRNAPDSHTKTVGCGNKELVLMTYGRALHELENIETAAHLVYGEQESATPFPLFFKKVIRRSSFLKTEYMKFIMLSSLLNE